MMDDLVKEAKRGNPDAFTQLIQMQMQNMYKTARAILTNDEDVADAISDTILVCFEKICQLKKEAYFRTWLTRILINKCNDILRKKRSYSMENVRETGAYDNEYENAEWKEALKFLDERYRLILILYYVEGFQTREISNMLDLPESTVRSRLSRGRKKLEREFNETRRSI